MNACFVLLAMLFLVAACEDEPITDQPTVDSAMVFGDTLGMVVTSMDVTSTFDPETGRIYLDMDGDSVADIRMFGYQNSSPGSGFHRYVMVECMHDQAALGVTRVPDTVFFHVFVTWQSTGDGHFDKLFEYRRSCLRTDDTDSIISSGERISVTPFQIGDELDESLEFTSDSLNLRGHYYGSIYSPYAEVGDTLFHRRNVYFTDCELFPQNEWAYVAVRLSDDNGGLRHGWIRMRLEDLTISVSEIAIERE